MHQQKRRALRTRGSTSSYASESVECIFASFPFLTLYLQSFMMKKIDMKNKLNEIGNLDSFIKTFEFQKNCLL